MMPSESTAMHRLTMSNRAHEAEIIQQHREKNNGDVTYAAAYEVLAMRRQPVRGL